jgi:hypothetical protein
MADGLPPVTAFPGVRHSLDVEELLNVVKYFSFVVRINL